MILRTLVRMPLFALVAALTVGTLAGSVAGVPGDATDPARNIAIPCEAVSTQGGVSRAAKDIVHLANVCGFVGTDVELQSRKDATGKVHDYAFVGTMGAGTRIFDVTDPAHPSFAGGYTDSGWENDVQLRGDLLVATFDGVNGEDSSASTCLKTRYPTALGQGVDIYRLAFDSKEADFDVQLLTCVANPPGGAHNATLSPDGKWLAISNCCSDWSIDVVDVRDAGKAVHRYRLIDESKKATSSNGFPRCPTNSTFTCVVMTKPDGSSASGLWRPHDVHFSRNAAIAYVAAINSTWIVDVSRVLSGTVKTIAVIPNLLHEGGVENPRNIEISHQADVSKDGKILVVSDERGGGLTNTGCNTDPNGVIGGLHFFALAPVDGAPQSAGATPATPKKLGDYFNPNPMLAYDPLEADFVRVERACTAHVFRLGGNGSTSPGPIQSGYDGVSRIGKRQLTEAWYGAGVWSIDFSAPSSSLDGVKEDPRSTWGNTLGWNVMPGADTWSAKEYKGAIFAGDMLRGFDVYRFADCNSLGCTAPLGLIFEVDPLDTVLVDPPPTG
jgi:WD40 repeat protein